MSFLKQFNKEFGGINELQLLSYMGNHSLTSDELHEVCSFSYFSVELHRRIYEQLSEETKEATWKMLIDQVVHLATNIIAHPKFPKELHEYTLLKLPGLAKDDMTQQWIESAIMLREDIDKELATTWLTDNIECILEHSSIVEDCKFLTEELIVKTINFDDIKSFAYTAILVTRWLYNDNCSSNMSDKIVEKLEESAVNHQPKLMFKLYANIILSGNNSHVIAEYLFSNYDKLGFFFQTQLIALMNKGIQQKDYRYSIT